MEAAKFFMFIKSAEYWELLQEGGELPSGMEHFFLRESALTLKDFLYNHLNGVGSVGGLEMVIDNDWNFLDISIYITLLD